MSQFKRPEKAISSLDVLQPGVTIWHSHRFGDPAKLTIVTGPSEYSIVENDESDSAYIPPERREPAGSLAGTMWIKVHNDKYGHESWCSLNDMSCYPGNEYNDNYIFLSYEDWQEASDKRESR